MIQIEKSFSDNIGVKHAIAMNFGTTALHVAHDTLPESEKAAHEVVSIPVHQSVSRDELDCIIDIKGTE